MTNTQVDRYEALLEVAEVLASRTDDVSSVVLEIHEQCRKLIRTPTTLLAILEAPDRWRVECWIRDEYFRTTWPYDAKGLIEQVVEKGPLLLNDMLALKQSPAREPRSIRRIRPEGTSVASRGWLGVPLYILGEPAGVLSVQSEEVGSFTEEDKEFLSLFADHASVSIEHAHLRQRLFDQARIDLLTGAYNRRAFMEAATVWLGSEPSQTVAALDLQAFKEVNDLYGHSTADQVLSQLSQLLQRELGKERVYRLGGDEFALFLSGPLSQNAAVIERLRSLIDQEPWRIPIRPKINVGMAEYPLEADRIDPLLALADRRMYASKLRRQVGD